MVWGLKVGISLWADGGMYGKNPGSMLYGSYKINSKKPKTVEFNMLGTNNMAEYLSLIAGLEAVLQEYRGVDITVYTDSMLVRNQVMGIWRVKADHLWEYCVRARELLDKFESWDIEHVPRREIVAVLGH